MFVLWGCHDESDTQWKVSDWSFSTDDEAYQWLSSDSGIKDAGWVEYHASDLKLIIAGSRSLTITSEGILTKLYECRLFPAEIVSGTAPGIDRSGEAFAIGNKIELKRFPADWDGLGKRAGHVRNRHMALYADALLLIWDGKSSGSACMRAEMLKLGKPVYEIVAG